MAYEQYWLAVPELPQMEWDMAVEDFAKVAAVLHGMGLRLAGPDGTGRAVLNGDTIAFNGVLRCGHARRPYGGVAWPDPRAAGIAAAGQRGMIGVGNGGGSGRPRMSTMLVPLVAPTSARTCSGTCADMPFVLERVMPNNEYTKVYGKESPLTINGVRSPIQKSWVGKYFGRCRTSYRPYDLAVCCALLVAKRRFGSLMVVASDGTNRNWADVRAVCQRVLGYGRRMEFGTGGRMLRCPGARTPAVPDASGRHVPVYSPDGDGMELSAVGRRGDGVVFAATFGDDPAEAIDDGADGQ